MSSLVKNTDKIVIESQYFGPITTFAAMLEKNECWIEKFENYNKRSFRNRMLLATANGLLTLSIPLKKGKNNQCLITKVNIDNSVNWQSKHWQAITSAYRNSAFFQYFEDDIKTLYTEKYDKLYEFNKAGLRKTLDWLKLNTTLSETTNYEPTLSDDLLDYRNQLTIQNYDKIMLASYQQVFSDRFPFQSNLSVLDLLFNLGNESWSYLKQCSL